MACECGGARPSVEAWSDTLTSVLAANLTQVSLRQNEDMRKISAYVAIAAIPTLLASIYGMNFEHMPELSAVWGDPGTADHGRGLALYLHSFQE